MKWFTFLFIALMTLPAVAQTGTGEQQNNNKVVRNPSALAILTRAVAAMGGDAVANTVEIRGRMTKTGGDAPRAFITQYRFTGSAVAFRKEVSSEKGTRVFASGGGRAMLKTESGNSRRYAPHVAAAALPIDIPVLLLAYELGNSNYRIELIDAGSADAPIHLRMKDETNIGTARVTTQNWYFDPKTYLPIRVDRNIPDVQDDSRIEKATCDYMEFQTQGTVLVPRLLRLFEDSIQTGTITIDSVDFKASSTPDFDMVEGAQQ